MSSSTPLPRPSLTSLLSSCFTYTKSTVTSCIETLREKRAEQQRLAQDPTKSLKKRKSTELKDFGTFEKDEEEEFDEFGMGSGDKISEWQAGWNVTNAIQVGTSVVRMQ